jgi:F0F1-type ATP synthase assembly protein I
VPSASNDDRPPMVVGMYWAQQIFSIAIEMALPAGLGHWADERWGTEPWLVITGAVLGMTAAMVHLMAIARQSGKRSSGPKNRQGLR